MLDMSALPGVMADYPQDRNDPACGSYAARWLVVVTKPHAERWAASNLSRCGYETYLPLVLVRRRDAALHTLWRHALIPLFARYLFVRHGADPSQPIYATPGVQCLLRNEAGLQYARAGDVEALQAGEAARCALPPPTPGVRPGDALQFGRGPFAGMDCLVLTVSGRNALVQTMTPAGLRKVRVGIDSLIAR